MGYFFKHRLWGYPIRSMGLVIFTDPWNQRRLYGRTPSGTWRPASHFKVLTLTTPLTTVGVARWFEGRVFGCKKKKPRDFFGWTIWWSFFLEIGNWKWWREIWIFSKNKYYIYMYLDPPRGAKWMLKGATKQPLRVQTPPLGGCWYIIYIYIYKLYKSLVFSLSASKDQAVSPLRFVMEIQQGVDIVFLRFLRRSEKNHPSTKLDC